MSVAYAHPDRREPRIPFFTPVIASGLNRCWATNISSDGIGLTALVTGTSIPMRGDEVELEFALGDSKKAIRVSGRVAWTSIVRPDSRLGLGIQYREVSQAARAALAMFLSQHRPRVIVALASPEQQVLARSALRDVELEFIHGTSDIREESLRAAASAIVFASDAGKLTAFLEAMWQYQSHGLVPGELPLAPILLCTPIDSESILPLFTDGKIYEVLRPPLDASMLELAVRRSCEKWALQVELRWASLQLEGMALGQQLVAKVSRDELPRKSSVIRASAPMQRVYELVGTVAGHNVPVLLTGETGTGKELAARELHALSKRANTPFVAQDCGALTETLLESELFGHVRGAFTGATNDHPGLFQIADGGTIFLDEIQNTSPSLQAKLLRVIEEGEVRPVGGAKTKRVDVRLIAACNVDLRTVVKTHQFRADFYYRLNRFPIELPPLRDHIDDVLPLTRYFVTSMCESMGRPLPRIDARVERALLAYSWPGNIRELKNAIERALLLTPAGQPLRWEVLPDDLRGSADPLRGAESGLEAQVDEFERRIIQMSLDRNEGVIRRAARDLAVNAVTLSRRMRRLGLTPSSE